MEEDTLVEDHSPEAECNAGGTAENKGVYDFHIGGKFPQEQEAQKDSDAGDPHDPFMPSALFQKMLLTLGQFIHLDSAPSISD